ncbi:MAG: excinuclease subunit [Candidatus Doudnabacteria bacterium]|nr:excinuclease subunit [Candidatus Doudnabacteria bacterium]
MALDIKEKLKNIPHKPGVYLFKGKNQEILYVGKAKDLKNRVSQYFRKEHDGRLQIPFLMQDVTDFEHIITDNDVECLLLENTLIKKYKPRYNIKLRDDKNYAFIKIDYDCEIPQIYTMRNPDSKNARYFGPYSSALKVRETLNLVRKVFPYCANKKVSNRPCFYYYLHRCPGVCIGKISLEEYQQTIHKISLFIAGNISEVKKDIQKQMREAASQKLFERAADLRDQMRSIEVVEERQKAIFAKKVEWDFISYFQTADKSTINVFVIRGGKMIDRKNFILEETQNKSGCDIIDAFMEKYYLETSDLPREIFVQELPTDIEMMERVLNEKSQKKHKITITKPNRAKKAELITLGIENAKEYFESWSRDQVSELSRTTLALDELQKVLKLKETPFRIECFDISNIQGTNSVASMVVFENGKPNRSQYRKFKIKIDGQPNDFAMMKEALTRRFHLSHREDTEQKWPLPNLLVVDGGKGQLGMAVEVLNEYALDIPVIGLAKREEEIFWPGKAEPILLPKSDYALQLLQRLRDEAHRFAITFHKKLRSKQAYRSVLDDIAGIGPKKKKLLIRKYGSVANIKKLASPEELSELASLVGKTAADELTANL